MREAADQQSQQAAHGTELLVFSSSEAADTVMYGISNVVPVGGFSGEVTFSSVAQVRDLISAGKISVALLPGTDVLTANDPRVLAVEQMCRLFSNSNTGADYVIYTCAGLTDQTSGS